MPALRLPIADSFTRRCLLGGLYTCLFTVLLLASSRGALLVAFLAVAAGCVLLPGLPRAVGHGPLAVRALAQGHNGQWSVQVARGELQLQPRTAPTLLPWVVYLPFRRVPDGRCVDLWVFRDAVTPELWRQLRVRLNVRWDCP